MEKRRNCSRGAISPLIDNILLPDLRFKHGPDFLFEIRGKRLFKITEVEIMRVDCNWFFPLTFFQDLQLASVTLLCIIFVC